MKHHQDQQEDETILNAILIACIIGIVIVVGLIIFYPKPPETFTALYFVNGSQYTKTPINGKVYFNFTIENHEDKDFEYLIEYLIDNTIISYENVNIGKDMNATLSRNLNLNDTEVHKIGIMLNKNPNYEIHFWTKL